MSSPRPARSHSLEIGPDRIVLRLPDPRLLRLISRSVLLTAVIVSFPWLRAAFLAAAPVPPPAAPGSRWIDDPFILPMLLRDLRHKGLLKPGDHAIFLGDAMPRLRLLRKYSIDPVGWKPVILDRSVDFVLAADGFGDPNFSFIDRVLRIGGVTAVRLGSDPSQAFNMPPNYRLAYIRRFGSTVVAIKKIAHADIHSDSHSHVMSSLADQPAVTLADQPAVSRMGRRLLSVTAPRAVLEGLEGALMEPPREGAPVPQTMYLPELMGEGWLDGYARRVFVDVAAGGGDGDGSEWFEKNYPKGGHEFETVKVEAAAGVVADWLRGNVVEDFVVMKAEAGVVEELLGGDGGGVIGFVDELFLECENEWQKGSKSRRAYWQCVNLYGRLRDEGVAVHQWWG